MEGTAPDNYIYLFFYIKGDKIFIVNPATDK